jgi:hypothetical protein
MLDSTVYATDTTDAFGYAYFNISPQIIEDTVFVTVTGKNLEPYEGFMVTIRPGCYAIYLKSSIDDSVGGNDDGVINPGEDINLPLWVENIGDSVGMNIVGVLQTNDSYTTVTDSLKSFGDILGHDSAYTGLDGYNFSILADCPDSHIIDFDLRCQDINDSIWFSNFSVRVHAAELIFEGTLISGGNGNNNFEPGETVTVAVTVKNQGSAALDNVVAILQDFSPYVGLLDSNGTYNHIGPDSSVSNSADAFVAFSDPTTPQGTAVDFLMIVSAGYYTDTLPFSLVIGKKHYFVWCPDRTPISGQNMHTILTNLGYTGDYGTDITEDLGNYTTVFVCCGVYSNNYIIQANSSEAIALTNFVNSGGRLYLEGGDVWYYDPLNNNGHNFCSLFGLNAVGDGTSNMGPVVGEINAFTNGMNFIYSGENNWMDHIDPSSGFLIFHDGNDFFNCGVAYDAGTYRTVGTSFELGLLNDASPPSTRAALLDSIMKFFGRTNPGIGEVVGNKGISLKTTLGPLYPNPFNQITKIRYQIGDLDAGKEISLIIYDAIGRSIKNFSAPTSHSPLSTFVFWDGTDDFGRATSAGIYFVRLKTTTCTQVEKIILLK